MRGRITGAILLAHLLFAPIGFALGGEMDDTPDLQDLATRPALLDYSGSPKEQLRSLGITTNIWVTQFYQGQTEGDATKAWFYGGKVDAFLKIDPEKLGLWPGLHVNLQYEHYLGENLNRKDFALIPVY
jgi:porin